jgi:putative transposase
LEPYSNARDKEILNEIEKIYLVNPTYGYRRIKAELNRSGYAIGKKKVVSMMGYLGIRAVYPKKRVRYNNQIQNRHPYLLDEFKDDKGKIILSKKGSVIIPCHPNYPQPYYYRFKYLSSLPSKNIDN